MNTTRVIPSPRASERVPFGTGRAGASTVLARYRVSNTSDSVARATRYGAVRPFQVNSAWQFLNTTGGFSPVRSIVWRAGRVHVNDTAHVVPLQAPSRFGATTLDAGDIVWVSAAKGTGIERLRGLMALWLSTG